MLKGSLSYDGYYHSGYSQGSDGKVLKPLEIMECPFVISVGNEFLEVLPVVGWHQLVEENRTVDVAQVSVPKEIGQKQGCRDQDAG